jgi:hypothetical protein
MPHLPHVGQANYNIVGGFTRRSKKPLFTEGAVDGSLQHVLCANCNSVTGHLQHHQKTEKKSFWLMSLWRKKGNDLLT